MSVESEIEERARTYGPHNLTWEGLVSLNEISNAFFGCGGSDIFRTDDYGLVCKMSNWCVPRAIHPTVHHVVVELMVLWSFFPCKNGFQVFSGRSLEGRGKWITATLARAINWMFHNSEVKTIYAGSASFGENELRVIQEVGMQYSHEEEMHGEVARFFKIEKANRFYFYDRKYPNIFKD